MKKLLISGLFSLAFTGCGDSKPNEMQLETRNERQLETSRRELDGQRKLDAIDKNGSTLHHETYLEAIRGVLERKHDVNRDGVLQESELANFERAYEKFRRDYEEQYGYKPK